MKVYCIYREVIGRKKIAVKKEDYFLIENYEKFEDKAAKYYYKDYNKNWFKSLRKAKKELLRRNPKCKIKRYCKDYWILMYFTGIDNYE